MVYVYLCPCPEVSLSGHHPWRLPSEHRQCKGRNKFPELRHINRLSYEYPKNCSTPHILCGLCFCRMYMPSGDCSPGFMSPEGIKRGIADNHRLSLVWEENNYRPQALRAKHPPRQRPLCQPWRHVTVAGVVKLGVSSTPKGFLSAREAD